MKRAGVVCLAVALLAAIAVGCGSGTSATLGLNSRASVSLVSRDIRDLHLIVSPRQGAADQPAACSDTAAGFGCTRVLGVDSTSLSFTTDEQASTSPYYVYVQNVATATRTGTLQIRMDGDTKVDQAFDIPAGATVRVARIFRNSADTR